MNSEINVSIKQSILNHHNCSLTDSINDLKFLSGQAFSEKYSLLITQFGEINVIAALAETYKNHPEAISNKISTPEKKTLSNRQNKTIGIYIKRTGKDGVAKVNSILVPMFQKMGYSVVMFTDEYDSNEALSFPTDVKWIIPASKKEGSPSYAESVYGLDDALKSHQIDLMIHNNAISSRLFWDVLVCKANNVETCLYIHELFSQEMAKCIPLVKTRINIYKHFDKICVLSKLEAAYWKIWDIPTICIQNPVEKAVQKESLGEYILWTGRYDAIQKRYMDAVEIMSYVCQAIPDAKMLMCGGDLTASKRKKLERKITQKGLTNNISVREYSDEMAPIYKNARLMLITSLFESFPMALCEGKSYGIPLVTYDMPYIEVLKNYPESYISVEQKDIIAAAKAVIDIWNNDDLAKKISLSAYDSIKAYQETDIAQMWKQIIENEYEEFSDQLCDEDYKQIISTMLLHYNEGALLYQKKATLLKKLKKNILYKFIMKSWSIKEKLLFLHR